MEKSMGKKGTLCGPNNYDVLQEADDHFVRSTPGRDSLYPLGEIICCSEDPSVLAT
jgi:hypothetical protein